VRVEVSAEQIARIRERLQNTLLRGVFGDEDDLLELNMIDLDRKILKGTQALLEKKERRILIAVTLAVFLLLHIREVDAVRNIFWSRYSDQVCPSYKIYDRTLF
jgi:hypothetical protein